MEYDALMSRVANRHKRFVILKLTSNMFYYGRANYVNCARLALPIYQNGTDKIILEFNKQLSYTHIEN